MTISTSRLEEALDTLEVTGRPVMLHTSLRSFGEPVTGGADGLLDAMVARGCTVLVPAFTGWRFSVAPPPDPRPERNGIDYPPVPDGPPAGPGDETTSVYRVDDGMVDADMGALPAALVARDDAHRGHHPLNSFAAVGPKAAELVASQSPTDVYGPIRTLADWGGVALMLGVGLNRMTALHLAEQRSGRRLFVRWARRPDGTVGAFEVGSCSTGFPKLAPALRPYARTHTVGRSRWAAYPLHEVLAAASAAMAADPAVTHCGDAGCERCRDSVAGGPTATVPLG